MRGAIRPMGVRTTSMHSRVVIPGQRAFSRRNFAISRFDFDDRFRHRRNRFLFNNCFNSFGTRFGCANPFLFGGAPFLGDPFVDPFYSGQFQQPEPQQQPVVAENEGNDRETAFELQAMRDEILAMRDEQRARDEARTAPSRSSAQQDDGNATLVFRDGRQLSVHSYAISDHTIWVLSPNSSRKIAVADLDVPATEQANAKNGVEFRLPH